MKKTMFGLIAMFAIMYAFVGCGSANTPTGVAEATLKCIQKGDTKGYVDLIYLKDNESGTVAEQKEQLVALLSSKMTKTIEMKQGLKSWEFVSEEISEEGDRAKVVAKLFWGDGSEDEQSFDTIKDENGKWMLNVSK